MDLKRSLSFLLLISMGLIWSCQARYFFVGMKDGWALNPSEHFNDWAEKNRFQVNDSLVFRYKKGEDSVLVVNREDYDKCNTMEPIKSFNDGYSVFYFDRSGRFFFISGAPSHCEKGQKLFVEVLAVRDSASVSPSSPNFSPSYPPKSSPLNPSSSIGPY